MMFQVKPGCINGLPAIRMSREQHARMTEELFEFMRQCAINLEKEESEMKDFDNARIRCRCPCTCGHSHGKEPGTCRWCIAAQKQKEAREMDIETVKKIKLEDGDLLVVSIPMHTPHKMVLAFRKHMEEMVARLGVKAEVVVFADEVKMEIVKRNELSDIKQRLDELEMEIDRVAMDTGVP